MNIPDVIRERGPLTVAAFMELALYHPQSGYYASAAQRSGRTGDFFTSVDVGPLFGALRQGDVILSVNGQRVATAAEAGRELQKVQSGRIARVLVWRMAGNEGGEVFVTVRKE